MWSSPFVARLGKDGAIDTTFGKGGVSSFGSASADRMATGLGEDASGHSLLGLENAQADSRGDVIVLSP